MYRLILALFLSLAESLAAATVWQDEAKCARCHADVVAQWRTSHHALAMQPATDKTIAADFSAPPLLGDREKTTFAQRDKTYFIASPDGQGKAGSWPVRYTLGVEPLQQFLLALDGGRLQAHSASWDTEKRRWFHLYQGQSVDHRHPLHWSGAQHNANAMCIECHTSRYLRNFDVKTQRFSSRWASVGVNCQACHGSAEKHLQWAEAPKSDMAHRGFSFSLSNTESSLQVEVCAQCHSRRSLLGQDPQSFSALYDHYQPAGLSASLYEVDGKIRDEVFEYGSFVQSRMYQAGVRCSDCHNPHSGEVKLAGDAVCMQCHNPQGKPSRSTLRSENLKAKNYQSTAHHRHREGSVASQCVSCHMPGKMYMQVDYRHDHSFSVPDPVRAARLQHTDPCLSCHKDKNENEIFDAYRNWYGDKPARDGGYAEAMFFARHGKADAVNKLLSQLQRQDLPAVRRAALIAELPRYPSPQAFELVVQSLQHPDPAVRLAGLESVTAFVDPAQLSSLLTPLLDDRYRAVRLAAFWQLLQSPLELRPDSAQWFQALNEYESNQLVQQDRAEAMSNLAQFYWLTGQSQQIQDLLGQALQRDPHFHPARVLLAQYLETNGQPQQAITMLKDAVTVYPEEASLHYALGMLYVRQGDIRLAHERLQQAHTLDKDNEEYAYTHAIALYEQSRGQEAIALLDGQLSANPWQRRVRFALIDYLQRAGQMKRAEMLLQQWREINPYDLFFQRATLDQ